MIKISYAITVSVEVDEPIYLIKLLLHHKQLQDEICVLIDKPKINQWTLNQLYRYSSADKIIIKESAFQNDFSKWKNELNSMCSGDYIFNIDADEYPSIELLNNIHELIELNPKAILYGVPRVNTVEGITTEHINKWKWTIDSKMRINYPDYQIRIYKNDPGIYWKGKVHERLNIWEDCWPLPMDTEDWVIYHPKQIERQEKQNNYYDTI